MRTTRGKRHRASRAPAIASDMVDQLVEARVREGVVLHLADRAPARQAEADGAAEDPRLGEWHVDAAIRPEPVTQADRGAKDTAGAARRPRRSPSRWRRAPSRRGARRSRPRRAKRSLTPDPPQLGQVVRERRRRLDEGVLEEKRRIGRRLGLGRCDALPASAQAHRSRTASASSSVSSPRRRR